MTRDEVTQAVASAFGLASNHENVQAVVGLSLSLPYKYWQGYAWWQAARDRVEADEGGRWGVAWLIAQLAVANKGTGTLNEVRRATLDAALVVQRELRRTYAVDWTTRPIEVLDYLGIAASDATYDESANTDAHQALVALCYKVASPSEHEVLDLLAEGLTQAQIADHLGTRKAPIRMRLMRLRQKLERLTP